jgi:hypothetical protein
VSDPSRDVSRANSLAINCLTSSGPVMEKSLSELTPEDWRVRLGGDHKEIVMAKVIEFWVPKNFRKPLKWEPPQQGGKVIEFCSQAKKSA